MAEAVLFNIVERIIAKLSSAVLHEFDLWWGVQHELQNLKGTVSTIQAVLLDAEEQYSTSNQVKVWLGMLKEAVYDADDLLDLFSSQALKKQMMADSKFGKEVRLFFSRFNQFTYGLKMAHKIKSIRERLNEIASNRKFHLEERPLEHLARISSTREREQTHSSLPNLVVGREEDKKKIVKVLLYPNSENNLPVISIVGIGGLGKTTLAQLLLNDEEVNTHFDLKLWVCVSENFDVKLVVEKILESVEGRKPENLQMNSLKNKLHESLNGKKYLLILDDVWNEDSKKWSSLMDLLVGGVEGSRIIITTRLKTVAMITRSVYIHELRGMSDTESWELFKQIVFVGGRVPSANLETIGKEILQKCVGVPLAIKTIGSLLYFKNFESEWLSFKNKELYGINQLENDILPTLRLSYNHLPSYLKHCFAYCKLFPKDYEINIDTLVELWIAQGFVQSSNASHSLKDLGHEYFNELLWRSFFQEVKDDEWGNIASCKMHDLMHDLAISVSEGECTSSNSNEFCVGEKTRHVSIDFSWQKFDFFLKASKVRTILLVNSDMRSPKDMIGKEGCDLIFSNFKRLRSLDLHGLVIEKVPNSIGKLELLRYLDLSDNPSMKMLPNSISRLGLLQVLKVDGCESLEELPTDIVKLVNLSRLSMKDCFSLTHMPFGIGRLTSLETLSVFTVDKQGRGAELKELKDLINLRGSLAIQNLRYVKNPNFDLHAIHLKERQHLQCLELYWNAYEDEGENEDFTEDTDNDEMALEVLQPTQNLKYLQLVSYRGAKVASWVSSLTNLVKLTLDNCKNIRRLPQLDQFPSLKTLFLVYLNNLEYIESGISCSNGGSPLFFLSLKSIFLSECPNLKGWVRCENDGRETILSSSIFSELPKFHCLSFLSIDHCPNLNSVPSFPSIERLFYGGGNMKQLQQLLESTISLAEATSSSSSSPSPLPQLAMLRVEGINETFLPKDLQQKLTSLSTLIIRSSSGIMEMECQHFPSLYFLFIERIPELVSLPEWLRQLPTLKVLSIQDCPNLVSLPEWMSDLTSLMALQIKGCPQLSERCKNNEDEDWLKIAHIGSITIDDSMIQGGRKT